MFGAKGSHATVRMKGYGRQLGQTAEMRWAAVKGCHSVHLKSGPVLLANVHSPKETVTQKPTVSSRKSEMLGEAFEAIL